MRKSLCISLWLLLAGFFSVQASPDTTKVLFIGNSITYFNNMPMTFEAMANALGDTTEVTMYAPGGTGFVHHVADPAIYALFRNADWDYVVLQPGSNESPGYSFPIDTTLKRAEVLVDSIRYHNPCAKVIFFEISYGVWGSTPANLDTYNATMDLIKKNIALLADSVESCFAPVGEAFRVLWNRDQSQMLWNGAGDIHPNAEGSYLAASVFYSSIFQKPCLASTLTTGLDPARAQLFRHTADSLVLNHGPQWRMGSYDQTCDFNLAVSNDTLFCSHTSVNYDSLKWDFGNGISTNAEQPVYVYSQPGTYVVSLTSYQHGCALSLTDTVIIQQSNHIRDDKNPIRLLQDPVNGFVILEWERDKPFEVKLHSIEGRLIYSERKARGSAYRIQLPDKAGIYILSVKADNRWKHYKVLQY